LGFGDIWADAWIVDRATKTLPLYMNASALVVSESEKASP